MLGPTTQANETHTPHLLGGEPGSWARVCSCVAFLVAAVAPHAQADPARCERLFSENSERATCNTLLGLRETPMSDEELLNIVHMQVNGMTPEEARRKAAEKRRLEAEAARQMEQVKENDRCATVFQPPLEQDVCRWYVMQKGGFPPEGELRKSVAGLIEQMNSDPEYRRHVTGAIARMQEQRIRDRASEVDESRRQKLEGIAQQARQEEELKRAAGEAEEERRAEERRARIRAEAEAQYQEEEKKRKEEERRAEERRARIRAEAEAQYQAEEKKRKKAEAKAAAAFNAEMARGEVGFKLKDWETGGFGTVMIARFWLQNNLKRGVKDFRIVCETSGESGTRLSVARKTLYSALKPKQRRLFELNMGFINSQSRRASCGVVGWT